MSLGFSVSRACSPGLVDRGGALQQLDPGKTDRGVRISGTFARLGSEHLPPIVEVALGECLLGAVQDRVLRHRRQACPAAPGPPAAAASSRCRTAASNWSSQARTCCSGSARVNSCTSAPSTTAAARDPLHARGLRQPRVGVTVDLREHPRATVGGGESLDTGDSCGRSAPGSPEVEHHRDGA